MSVYTAWQERAAIPGGKIVIWTQQGEALKSETEPEARLGVCRALVLGWILAQKTTQELTNFLNLWNTGQKDSNGDPVPYVPAEFVKKQLEYKVFKAAIAKLEQEILALKQASKSTVAEELQLDNYRHAVNLGYDSAQEIVSFEAMCELLDGVAAGDEGYYMLVMHRGKQGPAGGHAIGFGFRNSGAEIFDPNLGLFLFNKSVEMAQFFQFDILLNLPYAKSYSELFVLVYESFLLTSNASGQTSNKQTGGGHQNP